MNKFILSICLSDIGIVLFLLLVNQPGMSRGRYAAIVSSSANSCKWFTVLASFLFAAPCYIDLEKVMTDMPQNWAVSKNIMEH